MPLARQTVNAQGGSDARYSLTGLQRGARGWTDGTYWYDDNGLSLDRPNVNVAGLAGARELNGRDPTKDPIMGGSGGGGGGGGGGAIPGAGVYGQAVAAAKARYQQRLSDLNKQRSSLFRQSGFQGDINEETGLVSNLRTDPHNQYGTYQMLNRAQALRSQQAQDSGIGRGLGAGGGLAAQLLADAQFESGREDAAFGASLADQLGAFTRQQQDFKYEYDAALYQAMLEAARMAIENEDYGYHGGDDYSFQEPVQTSLAKAATSALGINLGAKPKATPAPRQGSMPATKAAQAVYVKLGGGAPVVQKKPPVKKKK